MSVSRGLHRTVGLVAALVAALAVALVATGCSSAAHPRAEPARTVRMTSSSGQAEVLLRPAGAVRGLVVFMHGIDDDQNQLLDVSSLFPVRDALLAAGYAIVTSNAHGDNLGNPASVQDQLLAVHDARIRLGTVGTVDILAFSMGGLDALLTASSHDLVGLRSVALLSPAVDQRAFVNGPFAPSIVAAFDHPTPAEVPAILKRSDPGLQPATNYRGYRYHFWHSPKDTTVPQSQSTLMARYLALAGVHATVSPLTGGHGDLSALSPKAVVDFFAAPTT